MTFPGSVLLCHGLDSLGKGYFSPLKLETNWNCQEDQGRWALVPFTSSLLPGKMGKFIRQVVLFIYFRTSLCHSLHMVYVFFLSRCFHHTKLPLLRGSNRCATKEWACVREWEKVCTSVWECREQSVSFVCAGVRVVQSMKTQHTWWIPQENIFM